MERAYN